ncbi:MAG: NUDIX domain-containing protein [Syntrophomonas sp.]
MAGSDETHVVTCFLEYQGKILLLKRSSRVGSYQQKWAGISGYLEEGVSPGEQALLEIGEETALQEGQVVLMREGEPLPVADAALKRTWVVHPLRFQVKDPAGFHIDWEHSEYRWIGPEDIPKYDTVPGLYQAWQGVR